MAFAVSKQPQTVKATAVIVKRMTVGSKVHKEFGDDGESRRDQQDGEGVLSDDERSFPEELGRESIYRQPEYCHHVGEPQAADQCRIRTLPGSNAHDGDDDGK